MDIEIIHEPFMVDIYGFSGTAINNDYAGTAFQLMGRMWQTVQSNQLKNKGHNIWVYESEERVFAGVALYDSPDQHTGLEHKAVDIPRYAYYKHIGPYNLIKQAGQNMIAELKKKGLETCLPYVEIYGHWTNDDTKLETELLMSLVGK